MIDKNEIRCLTILRVGEFYRSILVYYETNIKRIKKFELRVMNKKTLVANVVDEELVMNELAIRSNLRHPFLINQVAAFQDYDHLFYMTEYAPLKLLNNGIVFKPFKISMVRFYSAEIICCLNYLHTKGQIYTFLTPETIFVGEDGHIKLSYNFCNCINENNEGLLANIEFSSLDAVNGGGFSRATDYWSLGIILYLMAVGYTPFGGETVEETMYAMKCHEIEFPDFLDEDLKNLILRFLSVHNRLGAEEEDIMGIKSHPFFDSIDWVALEKKNIQPPIQPIVETVNIDSAPLLSTLYTTDFVFGDKDGFGSTFSNYTTTNFFG